LGRASQCDAEAGSNAQDQAGPFAAGAEGKEMKSRHVSPLVVVLACLLVVNSALLRGF
jgi:hypothetical protein